MVRSVEIRMQFLEFLYICCAIFHGAFVQGRSLSFFRTIAY
ncbi:RAxF-45 family protein [Bacillus massilioanorexius]